MVQDWSGSPLCVLLVVLSILGWSVFSLIVAWMDGNEND